LFWDKNIANKASIEFVNIYCQYWRVRQAATLPKIAI